MAPLPVVVTSGDGAEPGARQPGVVGLVDEPDLQRVTPLQWDPTDGSWLLAGGAGSGRTTALRALALAAARRSGPESLHLHVIDGHGSLADLGALPHLGTSARVDDVRACASLVQHLRTEVDRRLAEAESRTAGRHPGRPPTILLLVDGWEQLVEAQPGPRLRPPHRHPPARAARRPVGRRRRAPSPVAAPCCTRDGARWPGAPS